MEGDTIAAIATPMGAGGIGIVRISGPDSYSISKKIFIPRFQKTKNRKSHQDTRNQYHDRRLNYGHIVEPKSNKMVDEALVAYMPSPNSYTTEDVIEIQAHAGAITLKKILEIVLEHGARQATPGEFTKRAFLNGRIDLSQAEGVMDLIQARSEKAMQVAAKHIEGGISKEIQNITNTLESFHAALEADIEFGDEVEDDFDSSLYLDNIDADVLLPLSTMIKNYDDGHYIRDGLRLLILGKPNVGKSSLLNSLLEKERAIITEYPGTTRDSLEETISISGLPVSIIDTAGWHDTDDPVEKLGIIRTKELVTDADLILFLIDANIEVDDDDWHIYKRLKPKKTILVVNKIDLIEDRKEIFIPENWKFYDTYYISAKYKKGIKKLKKGIFTFAVKDEQMQEAAIMPNIRQKRLLTAAKDATVSALSGLREGITLEAIAIDIQEAITLLKEIKGENVKIDVLENIFSQFCIGK